MYTATTSPIYLARKAHRESLKAAAQPTRVSWEDAESQELEVGELEYYSQESSD